MERRLDGARRAPRLTWVSDAAQIVRRFLELLETGRTEEALPLLSDDIEWRNSGYPTLRGERLFSVLRAVERYRVTFRAELHHVMSDGDIVLTDRTDHIGFGRWETGFWVYGTVKVHDGRITLWDDHFATGSVVAGAIRGLADAARTSSDAPTRASAGIRSRLRRTRPGGCRPSQTSASAPDQ